jgi:hypothetical protein
MLATQQDVLMVQDHIKSMTANDKKILLIGDSFACPLHKPKYEGWPTLLAKKYKIDNLAEAGVGEYKILKQLQQIANIQRFGLVIVSHTSPSRIHTLKHPVHNKGLHKNCDLIYNDIMEKSHIFNSRLKTAKNWFKYFYDDDYQIDIYKLLRNEISRSIPIPSLHLDHFSISKNFGSEKHRIDFCQTWIKHRGIVNHYTEEGNQIVCETIIDKIEQSVWQMAERHRNN